MFDCNSQQSNGLWSALSITYNQLQKLGLASCFKPVISCILTLCCHYYDITLLWHDYFKNLIGKKESSVNARNEIQFVRDYKLWAVKSDNILDAPISVHEVCTSARKLKNKKSSAKDVISNEIIKIAVEILAPYFVKLFNHILFQGIFPQAWSEGDIVPLYKSGCRSDPENYRGFFGEIFHFNS